MLDPAVSDYLYIDDRSWPKQKSFELLTCGFKLRHCPVSRWGEFSQSAASNGRGEVHPLFENRNELSLNRHAQPGLLMHAQQQEKTKRSEAELFQLESCRLVYHQILIRNEHD